MGNEFGLHFQPSAEALLLLSPQLVLRMEQGRRQNGVNAQVAARTTQLATHFLTLHAEITHPVRQGLWMLGSVAVVVVRNHFYCISYVYL